MTGQVPTLILPDAGPPITPAYADALDLLHTIDKFID